MYQRQMTTYSYVKINDAMACFYNLGPLSVSLEKQTKQPSMDPFVLIDALAAIMGHEEKELCKPGHLALVIILETAISIRTTKQKVRELTNRI